MTKIAKSHNPIDILYNELQEEDRKYGGRRLEKPQSEVHKKRPIKNLKKAWMEHTEDFDEVEDFYGK